MREKEGERDEEKDRGGDRKGEKEKERRREGVRVEGSNKVERHTYANTQRPTSKHIDGKNC